MIYIPQFRQMIGIYSFLQNSLRLKRNILLGLLVRKSSSKFFNCFVQFIRQLLTFQKCGKVNRALCLVLFKMMGDEGDGRICKSSKRISQWSKFPDYIDPFFHNAEKFPGHSPKLLILDQGQNLVSFSGQMLIRLQSW